MFDVTALPANMRGKIMVSLSPSETNGTVCWEWTGATNSTGYGSMTGGRKGLTVLTHRNAYQLLVGTIPAGLTIDHLCRNKLCVNTDHMEPVTIAENNRRKNAAQTHCKQGHPFEGDNLRVAKRPGGYARRVCVACQRARNREWMRTSRMAVAS